jgi:two-component sensor histidine kinase/putative methionine-R-sulfoxide reductase with GAF domain
MGNGASRNREELDRALEYQRTLAALSRIGPEAQTSERLMHHAVAQVARVTRIGHVKIMRYRADRGDLLVEAGVGWKPGVVGHAALSVDYRSPAGRSIQTGVPVIVNDIRESEEFRLPALLRDHDIVSLANVPIMINGQTWGVFEVDGTEPFVFDEIDSGFFATFANLLGICLALHIARKQNLDAAADAARARARFDMTIRELQHRIKNNLQIIIAFLMQKMRELPDDIRARLDPVVDRTQAVALAHDLLSGTEHTGTVQFADYLQSLCGNLNPGRPGLMIEVDAAPVKIPIDRAVPAGLVVNELVTNSIKYAFGNEGPGRIKVHFALVAHSSEGCVRVEDDGKGMPIPPKKGRGLSLVEGFAEQIQGRVEYARVETGSRTILCFPVAL